MIADALNSLGDLELVEPEASIPEGARVIGQMTKELKGLFTLRRLHLNKVREIADKCKQAGEAITISELAEFESAREQHQIIEHIFWFELRQSLDIFKAPEVGVAAGWLIWVREDEPEDPDDCDCPACRLRRKGVVAVVMMDSGLPRGDWN